MAAVVVRNDSILLAMRIFTVSSRNALCSMPDKGTPMTKIAPLGLIVALSALTYAPFTLAAGGIVGTGTPASCTEAAFDTVFFNAQSSGGGIISFNCGASPHAIVFGQYKSVSTSTEIVGGDLITLSGGNSAGIFQIFATGSLKLRSVTVTRGYGSYGAIENFGILTAIDTRLEANTSTVSGGALSNYGTATLTNVVVTGNTAAESGGGIYTDGSAITVVNGTFARNSGGSRGGAIEVAGGTATISRSNIIMNSAASGGGIFQGGGTLTLTEVNVAINGSSSELGETERGGGFSHALGTAVLSGVSFVGNGAVDGGGIAQSGGSLSLTNVSFIGNRANLSGGAIDVTGGTATLTNVSLTYNTASSTKGVLSKVGGTLVLKNTVLANPGSPNCNPAQPAAQFSMSSDETCGFGAGRDNVAMEFGVPGLDGGVTYTQMPLAGNPVIDNGLGIGCPATDQRGVARPSGLACDVGAIEYVAGALPITSVVEYYNAAFGHHFVTLLLNEIIALDTGMFVGWARTGEQFNVYENADAGLAAVCRFFTIAFSPKSSHFYAPRGFGCEGTLQNSDWEFEGDVFYTPLPDANGQCPAGHLPVFRLYNNGRGGAPNHRFTTSPAIRTQMVASGYVGEGAGIGVGMCSPQ